MKQHCLKLRHRIRKTRESTIFSNGSPGFSGRRVFACGYSVLLLLSLLFPPILNASPRPVSGKKEEDSAAGPREAQLALLLSQAREALHNSASRAVDLARRSLDICQSSLQSASGIRAQHILAQGLFLLRTYPEAMEAYETLLQRCRANGDIHCQIAAENGLGRVHLQRTEYNQAMTHLLSAAKSAEDAGDAAGQSEAANFLGILYYALGDLDKAESLCRQAVEGSRRPDLAREHSNALEHLGIIRHGRKDYPGALKLYQQSLASRGEKDRYGLAGSLSNIGLIYMNQNEPDQAATYLQRSLDISRELGDTVAEAAILSRLGLLSQKIGDLVRAKKLFTESLVLFRKQDNSRSTASSLRLLAGVEKAMGNHSAALELFEQHLILKERRILNDDIRRGVAEAEARFEKEKWERRIELLQKDQVIQELQQKRLIFLRNALLAGLLLLIGLVLLIYNRYRLKTRAHRELMRAMDRIRTLSGLLPICANCKKIRDDAGYWVEVESYIKGHSDADFTHGICPSCMQNLYPEYSEPPHILTKGLPSK